MKWVVNRNLPHMFWNFVGACGARRGVLWGISFWGLLRLLTVVPLSKSHEVNFPSGPRVRSESVSVQFHLPTVRIVPTSRLVFTYTLALSILD
jgi:hypothetical protein